MLHAEKYAAFFFMCIEIYSTISSKNFFRRMFCLSLQSLKTA